MAAYPSIPIPVSLRQYRSILQELWVQLPLTHRKVFDTFFVHRTTHEIHTIKARLCDLVPEEFATLVARFANASVERLHNYLLLSVHGAPQPKGPAVQHEPMHRALPVIEHWTDRNQKSNSQIIMKGGLFNLPQELYDMMIENLFRGFYLPGKLVAAQLPIFDGEDCFLNVGFSLGKSMVLKRVDPRLYEYCKKAYWTNNTWKIPQGLLSYTMEFLQLLPDERYFDIRSLIISFSSQDSDESCGYYPWYRPDKGPLENLDIYDDEHRSATIDQHNAWFWKFSHITGLKLQNLILDFNEAYSIEGRFLGLETVAEFRRFEHGMPALTILAPTPELEQQIYEVFEAKNAVEASH